MSSEVKKDAGPNVAAGKPENVKQEPSTPQGGNQMSGGGPRGRGGNFGGRGGPGRGGRGGRGGGFNNPQAGGGGANKRDSPAPGASRGNFDLISDDWTSGFEFSFDF